MFALTHFNIIYTEGGRMLLNFQSRIVRCAKGLGVSCSFAFTIKNP